MKDLIDNEKRSKAWEEYTGKANNFADWFTAIIISNFVYLLGFVEKENSIRQLFKTDVNLWIWSFCASLVALIAVFFVKFLGFWAAKMRVDAYSKKLNDKKPKKCEDYLEDIRFYLSILFVFLGFITLVLNFLIIRLRCDVL